MHRRRAPEHRPRAHPRLRQAAGTPLQRGANPPLWEATQAGFLGRVEGSERTTPAPAPIALPPAAGHPTVHHWELWNLGGALLRAVHRLPARGLRAREGALLALPWALPAHPGMPPPRGPLQLAGERVVGGPLALRGLELLRKSVGGLCSNSHGQQYTWTVLHLEVNTHGL